MGGHDPLRGRAINFFGGTGHSAGGGTDRFWGGPVPPPHSWKRAWTHTCSSLSYLATTLHMHLNKKQLIELDKN